MRRGKSCRYGRRRSTGRACGTGGWSSTASDFGGYQAVLAIHAEGSIEAEKLATFRAHNPKPAVAYAKRLASIPEV